MGGAPLVLDRYRLGARLGAGGFGTVYAGHDERLDRPVAVKVIPAGAPAPERVQREALAAARLDHPAIVAVFDAGQDDDARYLVSELVRGRTLDRLYADGALSDRDVLRIGLALADALEHAHEGGVVHRDVKPQNVIVPDAPRSGRGVAKLADFGVAHLAGDEPITRTGDVVGTLAYMAPEQAAGRRVDARADLYSLALVLYEALVGVNPLRTGSPAATARLVGTILPPLRRARRELPEDLAAAIDRALLPRSEERGTLAELAQALADALPEVADEGGTVAPHPLERRPAGPPRWSARAGAGALAAIPVAAALAGLAAPPVPPAAAAAAAAVLVALLPRVGWLAAAIASAAALAAQDREAAMLAVAAAAPVPALVRGRRRAEGPGLAWSVPALAPLLGLAGFALAYPALAGRARRAPHRAALGALGAWALLIAQPLLHRTLLALPVAAGRAADVLQRLATPHTAALLALWSLAALVLPWLVRGRWLVADAVAATVWAAGLAAGTASIAAPAQPRGLIAGAAAAGLLAAMADGARDTVSTRA